MMSRSSRRRRRRKKKKNKNKNKKNKKNKKQKEEEDFRMEPGPLPGSSSPLHCFQPARIKPNYASILPTSAP